VRDSKIASMSVEFDARPFAAMFEGQFWFIGDSDACHSWTG
jgi:hypothetical protein